MWLILVFISQFLYLITFAGTPAARQLLGMSFVTTDPAPIVTLSPMWIFPAITTFAITSTLLPIIGFPLDVFPIVVQCIQWKLSPIDSASIIVEYGCANQKPPPIFVVAPIVKYLSPGRHQLNKADIVMDGTNTSPLRFSHRQVTQVHLTFPPRIY